MSKRYQLFTPRGMPIIGVYEMVPCVCYVTSFDETGEVAEYGGESNMDWDNQGPRYPDRTVYICADYLHWTFDQLTVAVMPAEEEIEA